MLLAQNSTLCHCALHFGLAWVQTSSQVFFIWCQSLQYYSSFSLEVKDKIGRPQHYIIHFHVDVLPQSSSSNGSLGGELNSPMKNNVFFIQSLKFEKDKKKRFTWKSVITISGNAKMKTWKSHFSPQLLQSQKRRQVLEPHLTWEMHLDSLMWPAETEVMVSQLCLMCGST